MRDRREFLDPDSWNVIDQRSGFKKKASEVAKQWDGLIVSKEEFETRHPQDFSRSLLERQTPAITRSESADCFISHVDLDTMEAAGLLFQENGCRLLTEDGIFIRLE